MLPSRKGGSRARGAATTAALVTVVLLAAGCGQDAEPSAENGETSAEASPSPEERAESPSVSPSDSPSASPAGAGGRVITTAPSDFGTMLFDRTGQAIYLFDKETTSTPECYGACAQAWPPVLTTDAPRAGGEADPELLGVTPRRNGAQQVTYDGHPLYYYAHEGKNEVLCHNVSEYGGLWLVVTPGGEPAA